MSSQETTDLVEPITIWTPKEASFLTAGVPFRHAGILDRGINVSKFVLVHGAWMGAWCWEHVIPLLKESGARVVAPDLPGHGHDQTPLGDISLDAYVSRIAKELEGEQQRVTLVGHSMGGIVISSLAERMPEWVGALVYVGAYLLTDGQSLMQAAEQDSKSQVPPNMVFAPDFSTAAIRKEALKDVFCDDAPAADLARLEELTRPEPIGPFNATVNVSEAYYDAVPRTYIHTIQDRAVTYEFQRKMVEQTPCSKVYTMNTSHTPFFAAPRELAAYLIEVSKTVSDKPRAHA